MVWDTMIMKKPYNDKVLLSQWDPGALRFVKAKLLLAVSWSRFKSWSKFITGTLKPNPEGHTEVFTF